MVEPGGQLRILVADGRAERLEEVGRTVASLGHEVISRRGDLEEIGRATIAERPALAIVIVGESSDDALRAIGRIVQEATCPVVASLRLLPAGEADAPSSDEPGET